MLNSGNKKPLDLGIVDRVSRGTGGWRAGTPALQIDEAWFGPGETQAPAAPSTKGRQWDYPAGYNLRIQPRGEEAVSFGQLRALAQNCDLVRLAIETRKDQLCKLKGTVRPKDQGPQAGTPAPQAERQAKEAREFLRKPDRVHRWNQWLRLWVEDMLVIDAATLYPRPNRGGGLYALEVMDGSLIRPVLDDSGRVPEPPLPAYQQVLKGIAACDYTREELIYVPRNPLSWRVYGLAPVEQIILTVNTILRRQIHVLQYYTEGNLPDSLLEVPEGWNTEQIREWQQYWDALFAGNTAQRRRGTWVPKGMVPHAMKEAALKDAVDEWFARVVCYCFSLSPQPFVQQMNKATAETAQETALQEGLAPLMEWVTDGVNEGLERGGFDLVEFAWEEETAIKPKEQAEIDDLDVKSGIRRRSEIRKQRGLEDDGVPDFIMWGMGPVLLEDIGKVAEQVAEMGDPAAPVSPPASPKVPPESGKEEIPPGPALPKGGDLAKVDKGKNRLKPIDRERPEMVKARAALQKLMMAAFKSDAQAAAAELAEGLSLAKAEEDQEAKIDRLLQELKLAGLEATWEEAAKILAQAAQNGGLAAFVQINYDDRAIVNQVNKLAVEWAENRAAELVGKKLIDGRWVVNPNPKWAITESTRDYLRADVAQAVEEGWSTAQLAKALEENFAFSEARAETISRYEIAKADQEGNMMAYRESGVVAGKEWIRGTEEFDCDVCDANAAAGVIPLEEAFPSGDQNSPAHPRCVCDILPALAAEHAGGEVA